MTGGTGASGLGGGAYIFHLIPHTHWDREWFLPRAAFHARLIPLLDDLIARLQADPSFRSFLLDGQTVLIEDYLRARPEREGEIKTGEERSPAGGALVRPGGRADPVRRIAAAQPAAGHD